MPSEKAVSEAIARLCRKRGAWSLKVHGSAGTRKGVPDRLICYRGRFVAVEEKQPGKKPTPLQQYELDQVVAAEGMAIVATSVDDVAAAFEAVDRKLMGTG